MKIIHSSQTGSATSQICSQEIAVSKTAAHWALLLYLAQAHISGTRSKLQRRYMQTQVSIKTVTWKG